MEIAITLFLGIWLSTAAILSYAALKKDYKDKENKK